MQGTAIFSSMVVAAALAVATTASAAAPVETSGTCVQGTLGVAADRERVRPYVPEPFELIEAGGRAVLFFYTLDCTDWRTNGAPPAPNRASAIAVFVHGRSGAGPEAFDMFGTHSERATVRAYRRLGMTVGRVTPTFDFIQPTPATLALSTSVPYRRAPFEFDLTGTATTPAGFPLPSVHWQRTADGFVRHDYAHTDFRASGGTGAVQTRAGSPLADMLGESSTTAGGTFFRFAFTGTSAPAIP